MTAYFERFTLDMTLSDAQSVSHSGRCDDDVAFLLTLPKIKRQLKKIPNDKLIAELKETGAWSIEELQDRQTNEERIVWIAGCNISEETYMRKNKRN